MSGRGRGYDVRLDGPNDPRVQQQQWSRENTIIIAEEHPTTLTKRLILNGWGWARCLDGLM